MTTSPSFPRNVPARSAALARGFTLTELAVVLTIVGLLIGGLLVTVSAQYEARQFVETRARLELAQEALIGFALRNGRLPCPAGRAGGPLAYRDGTTLRVDGTGEEGFVSGQGAATGQCFTSHGLLPALTLGLGSTDAQGFLLDAWDVPVFYSVTPWNSNAFTKSGGIAGAGITALNPAFRVCSAAACAAGQVLTSPNTVPAVIFSAGKNGRSAPTGVDELANYDGNNDFVSHEPRPVGGGGGEFDDIVTWLSVNILVNRMVAAGAL